MRKSFSILSACAAAIALALAAFADSAQTDPASAGAGSSGSAAGASSSGGAAGGISSGSVVGSVPADGSNSGSATGNTTPATGMPQNSVGTDAGTSVTVPYGFNRVPAAPGLGVSPNPPAKPDPTLPEDVDDNAEARADVIPDARP